MVGSGVSNKRSKASANKSSSSQDVGLEAILLAAHKLLRDAGLRCTPTRLAVLQNLVASSKPLSHEEVASKLMPLGFDHTTVYRCLVDLAEAGVAKRLDLGDHVWRFAVPDGHLLHSEEHPHFICVVCGKAICLPDVTVQFVGPNNKLPAVLSGVTEVILKGRCESCR